MTDAHPNDPRSVGDNLPANIEAEQSLIGAILYDNAALDMVSALVTSESFFEPFHGRIYELAKTLIQRDEAAEPILMAHRFATDPAFEELGGVRYLADLVDRAPPAQNAPDYANVVRELYQRRRLIAVATMTARVARGLEGDVQSDELIEEVEKELLALQTTAKRTRLVSAEEAVSQVVAEYSNPALAAGVMTGLGKLDEEIGGFMDGELWLLGGRPSMGKSALAGGIALHVARNGVHPDGRRLGVIEINAEMTPAAMMRRHITDYAFELAGKDGPQYRDIRRRKLSENEEQYFLRSAQELRGLETLKSIKKTGITLSTLRSLIRRQAAAWARIGIKVGLVTIDHVGLIRPDGDRFRSRTEAQNEVAIGLKELADELGVPILALAQLNRQLESRDDKRPTLPDLKDSGGWEENADGVIGVYRDAYYASREQEPKKHDAALEWEARRASKTIEAILLKVREGQTSTVHLWADIGRNVIRDAAPDSIYGHTPARAAPLLEKLEAPAPKPPGEGARSKPAAPPPPAVEEEPDPFEGYEELAASSAPGPDDDDDPDLYS